MDARRGCRQERTNLGLAERSKARRERIVVNRASSFEEADRWDLAYWQSQTPAARLAALVAIHRNIAKIPRAEG